MVEKLTPSQIEEFRMAYNLFDKDGDDTISIKVINPKHRNLASSWGVLGKTPQKQNWMNWSETSTKIRMELWALISF